MIAQIHKLYNQQNGHHLGYQSKLQAQANILVKMAMADKILVSCVARVDEMSVLSNHEKH